MLTKHPSRFMHKEKEIRVHGIQPKRDAYNREVFYAIFTATEGGQLQEAPLSEVAAFPLPDPEPEPLPPIPPEAAEAAMNATSSEPFPNEAPAPTDADAPPAAEVPNP